jgi:hypothetical protein
MSALDYLVYFLIAIGVLVGGAIVAKIVLWVIWMIGRWKLAVIRARRDPRI